MAGERRLGREGRALALPDPATYKASGSVFFPQFLDRGRVLASTSGGPRGDVEKVLAEGDDSGQVRLWDVADPSRPVPLARLARSRGKVLGLAMCPDGKVLATASTDGHVYLWVIADPKRPKLLAALPRYPGYLFTATSRRPSAPAAGSWPKAGKPARYACGT